MNDPHLCTGSSAPQGGHNALWVIGAVLMTATLAPAVIALVHALVIVLAVLAGAGAAIGGAFVALYFRRGPAPLRRPRRPTVHAAPRAPVQLPAAMVAELHRRGATPAEIARIAELAGGDR